MNNTEKNLKLITIHEEVGNSKTFSFETDGLVWVPGQYQIYTLPQVGREKSENSRYFTIASAPSEQRIDITTRISDSKFKKALNNLAIGESIQVSGLGGDFIWEEQDSGPVVFVAAGIGITPFRSMLLERKAKKQSLNATLIYFNRSDEIPFLELFKQLEVEHLEFKFISIVGEHVSAKKILELAPLNSKDGTVYISGPEPMVETIGEELKEQGLTLKQDWFPGYTDENF